MTIHEMINYCILFALVIATMTAIWVVAVVVVGTVKLFFKMYSYL